MRTHVLPAAPANPFGAVPAAPVSKVRAVKVMLMNLGQLGLTFRDAATAHSGVGVAAVTPGAAAGAHGVTMADTIVSVNMISTRGFHRTEIERLIVSISKRSGAAGLQGGLQLLLEPVDGARGLPFRSHDVASTRKWFWMPTSKEEVNEVVRALPPCGFVVRDAEAGADGKMAFICVINDQGVGLMNVKILEDASGKFHVKGGTLFNTLDAVVESLGPAGQRAMVSKATRKPFRVVESHAASIVHRPINVQPMTLQELAQEDVAFHAEAAAAAAFGTGAAAAPAPAPVAQRRPPRPAAPRRASAAERNRTSFFPADGGGGDEDDAGSDYDESTMDPTGIAMGSIHEAPPARGGGGGGFGGFGAGGKASTLPAGATLSPPPMALQRSNSSGGSARTPSLFDVGAVPEGLAAGSASNRPLSRKSSTSSAVAARIGLNQKVVNVLSKPLETHAQQEFFMPTADSAKYVAAGFLVKNSSGTDVLELEGKNKFSGKKPMVLKFSPQMYGVYVTPDVDRLEVAHISYKKKDGVFEVHGYKPCYAQQAAADKKEGRYAWAKMYAESDTKVGIGIAAEEGSKKGTHDFVEMYTAEQGAGGVWTMSRVDEDDEEQKYPVATIATTTKDFYTGQPLDVKHVTTVANEDCALAVVVAALLNDIALIL